MQSFSAGGLVTWLRKSRTAPNIFAGSILDPSPDRRLRSSTPRRDGERLQKTASQKFVRSPRRPIKTSDSPSPPTPLPEGEGRRFEGPVRWSLGARAAGVRLTSDPLFVPAHSGAAHAG